MAAPRHGRRPLVYLIGVDPLTARALCADIRPCMVRRWPLIGMSLATAARSPLPPDVVVIDGSVTDPHAAHARARWLWGLDVPILLVERIRPWAWLHLAGQTRKLILEPGVLQRCLEQGSSSAVNGNRQRRLAGWRPVVLPLPPPLTGGGE